MDERGEKAMYPCGSKGAQRGIALITALLLLLLLLSLSLGFTLLITSEQRSNGVDLDREQSFYSAYGAMEQLNAAVGTLFQRSPAPTGADITKYVLTTPDINGNTTPPSVPGMNFYDPYGSTGYEVTYPLDGSGNPKAANGLITQGPYQGFQGQITNYTITISLQSQNYTLNTGAIGSSGATNRYGSEIRLRRTLQTVAIPVFQFGIFSQTDLSFYPGPAFNFGGVVATNGNLYLAGGSTLTLSAQTSAYGDVIRDRLSNGYSGSAYQSNYAGNVSVTTSPGSGSFRNLAFTEGSINGGPSGAGTCPTAPLPGGGTAGTPNAGWTTISVSDYNSNLRSGAFGCARGTGGKNLQLPLVQYGASGIDLIKLPPPNEILTNSQIYCQRYSVYPATSLCPGQTGYAMLRIFIADTVGDITQIPEVSATPPVALTAGTLPPVVAETGGATVLPPWAASQGGTANCTPGNTSTNCGDWFKPGMPRLGMGDGTTSITPSCTSGATAPNSCGPYIKIEYQDPGSGGVWVDKTAEILGLGTTGRNLSLATTAGASSNVPSGTANPGGGGVAGNCPEPYPNAVIRLQRLVDVPSNYATYPCGYGNPTGGGTSPNPSASLSLTASDYAPNALFDSREGLLRDCWTGGDCPASTNINLIGVMNYVEIDAGNLAKWMSGSIGLKGAPAAGTIGYLLYVSDRRGNQVDPQNGDPEAGIGCGPGKCKLGNLGWEDFVNPLSANGIPNNQLDTGEDLHGANETAPGGPTVSLPLEVYGGLPAYQPSTTAPYLLYNAAPAAGVLANGSSPAGNNVIYPKAGTTSPQTGINLFTKVSSNEARLNPPLFFTRAVKLTDAQSITFTACAAGATCGMTITSENPVYVEGNYNAPGGNFSGADTPSAILADAVTFLSINWNDINSFVNPYNDGGRNAATSFYRVAILGGKTLSFPRPSTGSVYVDFGTDGGVHNFIRYLENWGGGPTLNYNGSLVSFFFSEQAVGTYKDGGSPAGIYNPPSRAYNFDTNFLTPSLLPPRTPTFRDINTLGFTQLIMPSQQ